MGLFTRISSFLSSVARPQEAVLSTEPTPGNSRVLVERLLGSFEAANARKESSWLYKKALGNVVGGCWLGPHAFCTKELHRARHIDGGSHKHECVGRYRRFDKKGLFSGVSRLCFDQEVFPAHSQEFGHLGKDARVRNWIEPGTTRKQKLAARIGAIDSNSLHQALERLITDLARQCQMWIRVVSCVLRLA